MDGQARITISDKGSGIEPEFLPHVFNRFAQEDGSTVRRHGGLGLGLAIARHLVEAQGGTIQAESAGKGKGATFSVMLPLMRTDADELEGNVVVSQSPSSEDGRQSVGDQDPLGDLRVLVVDDDLGTRHSVADVLSGKGAQVRVPESATQAMTAVEAFRPDVLVCDVAMPGEDGYSLIRRGESPR